MLRGLADSAGARLRNFPRGIVLVLPALTMIALDLLVRHNQLWRASARERAAYGATVLGSLVAWSAWMALAGPAPAAGGGRGLAIVRRVALASFVPLYTVSLGTQAACFIRFRSYSSVSAVMDSDSLAWTLVASLPVDATLVGCIAVALLAAIGTIVLARRSLVAKPRARTTALGLLLFPFAFFFLAPTHYMSWQPCTPDLLYFHGVRVLAFERWRVARGGRPRLVRVQRRSSQAVPALTAKPARPRNVLMLLQEAVRADCTCIAYSPQCALTNRASNRAAPERIPFSNMRAVGSSTALVLGTLWSGLPPTSSRSAQLTAPLVWQYAHAAGYRTAYWTSQHGFFANARLYYQDQPLDVFATATHLDARADQLIGASDEAVSRRALDDLETLGEPFFAVVHYSNVHKPRAFDPRHAPFQPTDDEYTLGSLERHTNFYRNSSYLSDLAVAELLEGLKQHEIGKRTVVVYLSDHGEGFFEHGQDNDHSGSVFDEEIRIPMWIDAPEGTLTDDERKSLIAARDAYLFQTDVCPTLLDLLGIWDAPELAASRRGMPGLPLTRAERNPRPVPLTNVSWLWEYGQANWGVMQGSRKLVALYGDEAYRCYDVATDPGELHDLGRAACGELAAVADRHFGMMPKQLDRLSFHPDWGQDHAR
jgi:glucan phosphoethanolaminetransferase (alkaline phosphatase superfamily)